MKSLVASVIASVFGLGCGEVTKAGQMPDAGDGTEPDSAVPIACETDGDCSSPNPRGCNLDRCGEDNTCEIIERHDGADFVVDPIFSAEINVSGGVGAPFKVMWDGANFVVVYTSSTGFAMKRVSPDGAVLDTQPAILDPRLGDIVPYNGNLLVATTEPPADPYEHDHFALHQISSTGALVVPKSVAMWDSGNACPQGTLPNLAGPVLASNGTNYMLSGMVTCGFLVRGVFSTSAPQISWDLSLYRPRGPRITGGPAGFAILTEELRVGGGATEAWAQTFNPQGAAASGYGNKDPHNFNGAPCCVRQLGMATGTNGFLMAWTRNNSVQSFRAMDTSGTLLGTAAVTLPGNYASNSSPAMGYDGKNYLVVPDGTATFLPGHRLTEQGENLDATPIQLTPDDAAIESAPQLGGDGMGLYAIAYVKSTDNNVYIRTFATCP